MLVKDRECEFKDRESKVASLRCNLERKYAAGLNKNSSVRLRFVRFNVFGVSSDHIFANFGAELSRSTTNTGNSVASYFQISRKKGHGVLMACVLRNCLSRMNDICCQTCDHFLKCFFLFLINYNLF